MNWIMQYTSSLILMIKRIIFIDIIRWMIRKIIAENRLSFPSNCEEARAIIARCEEDMRGIPSMPTITINWFDSMQKRVQPFELPANKWAYPGDQLPGETQFEQSSLLDMMRTFSINFRDRGWGKDWLICGDSE